MSERTTAIEEVRSLLHDLEEEFTMDKSSEHRAVMVCGRIDALTMGHYGVVGIEDIRIRVKLVRVKAKRGQATEDEITCCWELAEIATILMKVECIRFLLENMEEEE